MLGRIINYVGYSRFNKPIKYYSVYIVPDKLVVNFVQSQRSFGSLGFVKDIWKKGLAVVVSFVAIAIFSY